MKSFIEKGTKDFKWIDFILKKPMKEIQDRLEELNKEIPVMERTVAKLTLQEFNIAEMKNEKINEYRDLEFEKTCIITAVTSVHLQKAYKDS